jgi:hypothetical protein
MTAITLNVPDDLARRLNAERERLPQILEWAINSWHAPRPIAVATPFVEMIEFLSSRPTPDQILAFKISATAQTRLADLLDKNREEGLNDAEHTELDWYEYVHEIMTRLKAQTRVPTAN